MTKRKRENRGEREETEEEIDRGEREEKYRERREEEREEKKQERHTSGERGGKRERGFRKEIAKRFRETFVMITYHFSCSLY